MTKRLVTLLLLAGVLSFLAAESSGIDHSRLLAYRDPNGNVHPVNTPADLNTEGEAGIELLAALVASAKEIEERGIALDAPWGEVQVALRNGERIAIHGGPGTAGVLNVQIAQPIPGGVTPVHGTSYIQIVGFDEDGPVADAILSYSESTNPASPHYADQTEAYSAKAWNRLPFSPAEIAAAQEGEALHIEE